MLEELEPQEWVEKAADHHHEHAGGHGGDDAHQRSTMRAALTAAIMAVLAAIGGLLSGHAANDALLLQTRASDQWAYYQAKSIRGHLYEVAHEVVLATAASSSPRTGAILDKMQKASRKYGVEKDEIGTQARELERESAHEFTRHQAYSVGIAAFQVAVVLASVSIMVRNRWSYPLSLLAGAFGVVELVRGFFV